MQFISKTVSHDAGLDNSSRVFSYYTKLMSDEKCFM